MPQASFRFSVRRRPFFCESFSPCRCYASIFFLSVLSYLRFVKRPDPNFGRWTKFLLLIRHLSGIFALFRGGSRSFFTNFPGGNFSASEISSFSSGKRLDIPCPRCYLSGAKKLYSRLREEEKQWWIRPVKTIRMQRSLSSQTVSPC